MTPQSKQLIYATLSDKVPPNGIMMLDNALNAIPDEASPMLLSLEYKSPIVSVILSTFFGVLGVGRFYVKSKGIGLIRLLLFIVAMGMMIGTSANLLYSGNSSFASEAAIASYLALIGFGYLLLVVLCIWSFVDTFFCYKKCKQYNMSLLSASINEIFKSRASAPNQANRQYAPNQTYNPNNYIRK